MDLATIGGLILAAIGIVGGLILEGGTLKDITQPTAALIVMGGTIGSVLVSFPLPIFLEACKELMGIFIPKVMEPGKIIEQLVAFSTKARKEGIVALETDVKEIKDDFLKKALMMAVDGADPKELEHALELQMGYQAEHGALIPKVWEGAGGFAPTIGIIGAVMGLIQVMKNLADIEAVGHGIAVAFVATIYGVAVSNIFFLPAAAKLSQQHKKSMVIKEMIVQGVVLVIEGVNPMIMRDKLSSFFVEKLKEVEDAKKG